MSSNFNYPNPQQSIGSPDFTPKTRIITAMTRSRNSRVTTSVAHGYVTGWTVSLYVTEPYGFVLNNVDSQITVVSTTEFDVNVDTTPYPVFSVPTFPPAFTQAHVVPISGVTDNVA